MLAAHLCLYKGGARLAGLIFSLHYVFFFPDLWISNPTVVPWPLGLLLLVAGTCGAARRVAAGMLLAHASHADKHQLCSAPAAPVPLKLQQGPD